MENLEDLIRRWQLGWQASRGLPDARETEDALWAHCKQPGREFEVFALHADEDPASLSRLAAQVLAMQEQTWLTATTRHPEPVATAIEAAGLEVHLGAEWLMGVDLAAHPERPLDPAYTCEVRTEDSAVFVAIHDDAGDLAARGQIGLAGPDAVADRIETMSAHRRRGLGGVVMGSLAAEAVARGARTGLLVASAEGQRLYSALGWSYCADVMIARVP